MTESTPNEKTKNDDLSVLGKIHAFSQRASSKPIKLARSRYDPIDVYPWFEITVEDINSAAQLWHASIEIHLFWQDYNLPNMIAEEEFDDFDLHDDYVPVKMSEIFENKVDCGVTGDPTFQYYKDTGTIYMMFVVDCTFVERMELQRFPMDRQFLGMDFNAWTGKDPNSKKCNWNWITNPPEWVQNDDFRKPFAVRMLSSITEYEMLSPWIDFTGDQPLSIRLRVERQPGFYAAGIILPNFLIISAAFAAFPILIDDSEPDFIADRLSISVTLMLTAVAFRYVITDQLPKVTYLTIMDYYLLEGFIMLTLLIFENAFVGITSWEATKSQNKRQSIDQTIAIVFCILWGLTHIFWGVVLINKSFMRISWEKMDEIDSVDDDEFSYAPKNMSIGRPQSKEVIDEWNKKKGMSPNLRASVYAEEHPGLGPSDNESELK
eukprot:552236_1